ncbi:hypothetical protein H2200_009692 [Cladophialophora chaetospira]|uniref:Uncharacterized protein n=1 Tax=Cladophialophora chaetospira TaxID=386627 RepID=A0AA39CEZ2_9EURO|nr:hypothetical protein H2200_009692 [Cladophialophora chaetospira]
MTQPPRRDPAVLSGEKSNSPTNVINPVSSKGKMRITPLGLGLQPMLEPFRPSRDQEVILGFKAMYRAQAAISSPPSMNADDSDDHNNFVDVLTKLAIGMHPQDALSEMIDSKKTGEASRLTESELVTHLARFPAQSLGIYDDDVALERRLMIVAPNMVEGELGTMIVDGEGWLRLVKESAVNDKKLAYDEDDFFTDAKTPFGDYDFREPFEVSDHPPIASKPVDHKRLIPSASVHTSEPGPEDHLGQTKQHTQEVNQAAKNPSELHKSMELSTYDTETTLKKVTGTVDDSTAVPPKTTMAPSKKVQFDPTTGEQSESNIMWTSQDTQEEEMKAPAAKATVEAPEESQKLMSSKERRKEKKRKSKTDGDSRVRSLSRSLTKRLSQVAVRSGLIKRE